MHVFSWFGILSDLNLAVVGICLEGFSVRLFVWVFFSLISKLCYLSSQWGCSSILSFKS